MGAGSPSARERLGASIDAWSVLDGIPGVVAVISAEGEVLWINDSISELTGFTSEELIGSNMLEHLDLEWNPLALESIAFALDNPGMRLPTMLRFHTKHGGPMVMEATANNQLDAPDVGGLIVHLRPSDERQMLDQILESFTAGEDLASTLRRVHDVATCETLRADAAVVLRRAATDHQVKVFPPLPVIEVMTMVSGPTTPWAMAAAADAPVLISSIDELPSDLREVAADEGYKACWAYPVSRPGTPIVDGVLVLWRREAGPPEPSATMMAERLVRLCELVLERVEHSRELQYAAEHDPLTGLVNRAHFFDAIDRHLLEAKQPLGVLYLDLDGFKPINDQHGHGHGDRVLEAVADRLRASVRAGDIVARLGGDEFAIASPGADEAELIRLAERLLAVVRAPITAYGTVVRVGTSVGLAACPPGWCTGDLLVAAADGALITAKSESKGTWRAASLGI